MDAHQSDWIEFAKVFRGLISDNIWAFVVLLFLYFARGGIGQFVKRLVNLDFSWGEAKGSIKAEPTTPAIEPQPKNVIEHENTGEIKGLAPASEETKSGWLTLLRAGQKEEAERAFENVIASVADPLTRATDRSVYLYFTYTIGGDRTALEKHQNLFNEAKSLDQMEAIAEWLSYSYHDAKNIKAEKYIWESLLALELPESKRAYFITKLADCLEQEKKIDEACSLVETNLKKLSDDRALCILFNKLGSLQKENGNKLLAAIAYEKALQFQPDDKTILFSAAYAQSQANFPYLSYFNYDTLITLSPDSDWGYNNIGVQAANLGMQGTSVQYYRRAIEKNNTLAMANIAYLYINQGFYEEANAILKKALEYEEPHQSVSSALSELEKKKQDEQEVRKETWDKATKQRNFIQLFSEARFLASTALYDRSENWCTDNKTTIELVKRGDIIDSSWEQTAGALPSKPRKHIINASVVNRALTGKYTIEASIGHTLFGYEPSKERNFIAYFTSDLLELNMMFLDKDEPMFMKLVKPPSEIESAK